MKDLKVVAKGNMSLVLSSEKMGKAYKCIPHSSTLCKPSCQSLKQEAQILNRLNPFCQQLEVSIQHSKNGKILGNSQYKQTNNSYSKCEKDVENIPPLVKSCNADLLTYQEEFPSLGNEKKNKNKTPKKIKQKDSVTQKIFIPNLTEKNHNKNDKTEPDSAEIESHPYKNSTYNKSCFIKALGPIRYLKQSDLCSQKKQSDDNFLQNEGKAILEFIKQTEGYDLDLNICLIELQLMHCDYLDFLNVKPPLINKMAIFEGIVEALDIFHNVHQIAHNDVRLPNLFLNKIENRVQLFNSKNMSRSFEGEEFWNFRGVLGDFGYSGLGQQVFDKMTKTNLSPEALRSKKDKRVIVDLFKNDIFSLGICIFWSCFGFNPYENIDKREDDILFKKLISENEDDFWQTTKIHRQMKKIKSETSKEFIEQLKDLLKKMLCPQQEQRINIKEVKEHDLFKKTLFNYQQQYIQHAGLQKA
ncbi:Protein kinase-like domain [Pseudocohnilembus persalinus]|uniref:Protein kinase-like domain n=1 Tax=Pseudocohnilembus persalinus TaxID=266149 RepID=A0A0V0QJ00_PSEPJ|nr:Protein kinase-like domain [Pseudocohnilembus persalinus]|eukprot:KRX02212.1 Protein kinase-like domain [Pseudocohnilembus persalinus]